MPRTKASRRKPPIQIKDLSKGETKSEPPKSARPFKAARRSSGERRKQAAAAPEEGREAPAPAVETPVPAVQEPAAPEPVQATPPAENPKPPETVDEGSAQIARLLASPAGKSLGKGETRMPPPPKEDSLRKFIDGDQSPDGSEKGGVDKTRNPAIITESDWFGNFATANESETFRESVKLKVLGRQSNPEEMRALYDNDHTQYVKSRISTLHHMASTLVAKADELGKTRQRLEELSKIPGRLGPLSDRVKDIDPTEEVRLWVHAAICYEEAYFMEANLGQALADKMPRRYNDFDQLALVDARRAIDYWERIRFARCANEMRKRMLILIKGIEVAEFEAGHFFNAADYAKEQSDIHEKRGDIKQAIECLKRAAQWTEQSLELSQKDKNKERAAIEKLKMDSYREGLTELVTVENLIEGSLDKAHSSAQLVVWLANKASDEFEADGDIFGALRERERADRFSAGLREMEAMQKEDDASPARIRALIDTLRGEIISERDVAEMGPGHDKPARSFLQRRD